MFTEELTAIREAEERSESIRKNVKTEVKRMIEAAKAEAEKILDDEENKAKEIYDTLIKEGMNEADSEYEAAIEKAHIDAENMVKAAEAKKDKVIDDLTESTMVTLMTQIVGDTAPDGQSMLNLLDERIRQYEEVLKQVKQKNKEWKMTGDFE